MKKLNVTQAGVTSLAVAIIGQVLAVVPSLSPEKSSLISTASLVIAVTFAAVHAVHTVIDLVRELVASRQVTVAQLGDGAKQLARQEVGKALGEVDLSKLAEAALAGANVPGLVKEEAQKLLGPIAAVLSQPDPAVPVVPPPAVPPVA